MEKIRIALVDDQLLFRQGLIALIRTIDDTELVAEASDGQTLLQQLENMTPLPDLALIDMDMPGMNGVELNQQLRHHYPSIRVLILSIYGQERFISRMIEAGACGYLVKNCDTKELITAIRTTYQSGFYFNHTTLQAMRNALVHRNQGLQNINRIPIELTQREKDVLELICKEYTNAEIAEKLFISTRTVEGHRNNLLLKTGCRNTAGLVIFAIRNEIVDIEF